MSECDPSGYVKQAVSDIARMQSAGEITAIACVMIDTAGEVRTIFTYSTGQQKLPLIAGAALLSNQLLAEAPLAKKVPG